jgi:hypothetical protein
MKLLTVGDSFTYGEELADNRSAWPNLLANKCGYEVTNLGRPGESNTGILRNTMLNADNADIVIIAWSHYARMEMSDENGVFTIWPGNAGNLFNGSLSYRHDLLKHINHHHDDFYMFQQLLINIILLQNYLKSIDKKYLMLDSFNEWDYDKNKSCLSKLIQRIPHVVEKVDTRYYMGWPNETMMQWTYECPKGPRGHFLEQGHEKVADKIYEYIRHLGWIS